MAQFQPVPFAEQVRLAEQYQMESLLFCPDAWALRHRFINVRTQPGYARVPPRQSDGFEDKYRFVRYVERTEGIQILHLARQDRQLMKQRDDDPAK